MTNPSALFADRILNVALTGSLIRVELGQFEAPEDKSGKPRLVATRTIVMPMDGFVASFGMLEAIMKKLLDDGLVKRQDMPAVAPAPSTKQ